MDAIIISPGTQITALAPLPIDALRLPRALTDSLRVLGFEQIRDLTAAPRAPLVRRFGPLLVTRLDQAHGAVFEPIIPLVPPDLIQARLDFTKQEAIVTTVAAPLARPISMIALPGHRLLIAEYCRGNSLAAGTSTPGRLILLEPK